MKLTPDGAEVLTKIYRRQVEWSQRTMEQLSPTQLVQIADGLKGIAGVPGVLTRYRWRGRSTIV